MEIVQEICCLIRAEAYEHNYSHNSEEQPGQISENSEIVTQHFQD